MGDNGIVEREQNLFRYINVSSFIVLGFLSLWGFSKGTKKDINKVQANVCWCCGDQVRLEYHHRIPESQGGSNSPFNCVGLCGPGNFDCHEIYDQLAHQGQYFPLEWMPILNVRGKPVKNHMGPLGRDFKIK